MCVLKFNKLVAKQDEYLDSIKKLFPKGEYWDKQFADETSDLSLWLKSKAENLLKFKAKFENLLVESNPRTAITTIESWEYTLLGAANPHLPLAIRRGLLLTKRRGFMNKRILESIAGMYTANIKKVYYPFRSAFFGHSKIGIDRMCSPASFSLIFIYANIQDESLKADFENEITTTVLANNIVKFFYN